MKNLFDKIKTKWRDNKAELFLQAFSLLLALTLLCVGFTTTLSAQDVSTAADNVVSTGIYELKAPSTYSSTNFEISINFKATYYDVYFNSIRVRSVNGENIVEYFITSSNVTGVPSTGYLTVAEAPDSFVALFNFISVESTQTLSDADYEEFTDIFVLSTPDLPDDPDEPADEFVISKGSYLAGSGYTFPNQFISGQLNFTSYNRLTGDTMRFSAMRIGVANDIAYIDYYDTSNNDWLSVYVDGWQLDSYQSITVLDSVVVADDFYTKFNQIFLPASDYDAGFSAGYDEGFWEGKDIGYEEGYRQGYLQGGADSGGDGVVGDMITSVFNGLDNVYIYANYSVIDLVKTIIGIFGAIWLLKLLAGG